MEIGFECVAAKPKGLRSADDEPRTVPMRPRQVVQKNPTTDQKKVRRQMARNQRTATEIPSNADKLRPGDVIRGPNNSTVTVRQVRLHKADSTKVLVDTDSGTIMVPRSQTFTLVPVNNRQRELPDQGPVPNSPVTSLPMGGGGQGDMHGGAGGSKTCPVCGTEMQMRREGQNSLYVCPRDGYSVQANGLGATSDPDLLPQRRSTLQTEADLRGKPECRGCGGTLLTDAVDHTEGTVHAHCEDCGMEHQLQNVQHATGAKKEWVAVKDFDSYITTTANTKSAIASRAHAVLNAPEGSL